MPYVETASDLADWLAGLNAWGGVAGHQSGHALHKHQMGIDWMTGEELGQAIPPAYTRFIGQQLMRAVAKKDERPRIETH